MAEKRKRSRVSIKGYLILLLFLLGFSLFILANGLNKSSYTEDLYFLKDGHLWRINLVENADAELVAENIGYSLLQRPVWYGDTLIYANNRDREIRQLSLSTGEDSLLLTCAACPSSDFNFSFDLSPDEQTLAYIRTYTTEENPQGTRQLVLFDMNAKSETVLLSGDESLYEVRWISNTQLEYSSLNNILWSFDLETGESSEIPLDSERLYSPDNNYYLSWRFTSNEIRGNYSFYLHNADGSLISDYSIAWTESTPSTRACWRPDSTGILFYGYYSGINQQKNQLEYYDIEHDENRIIISNRFTNDFINGLWSPEGRYMFIDMQANNISIYDMQTATNRPLYIAGATFIPWFRDTCRPFPSFPAG